ncbi:AMP-binding protein [Streptomyces spiralis]|uniref:AMP-binding protein n=1 Tax=Streptomyces spiralis TaxID=66376 RepID=UPI0036B27FA4
MATLSVAAILAENARRRPGRTALVEGDLRLTFAQVWQRAGALVGLGVRSGDRVALMAPNTAEFPQAYYAIAAVGAVVVPAPGARPEAAEVTAWSKERLGRHKYPRRVEFTDALPLGPSMKVLKQELRARYAGA